MSAPTPSFFCQALFASASALALAACPPASAGELEDSSVFYCPPTTTAFGGQPTKGIMCDAQLCFSSQTPGLSSAQTQFLLNARDQCRSLSAQEILDFWPRDLASGAQHALK